jgi:circadian clock protein KaiC
MGLLDKLAKEKDKPSELKADASKLEAAQVSQMDLSKITKVVEKNIKTQETEHVEKPTVHFKDSKVHIFRPEGTLDSLKPGKIDLKSIKDEIEAEMNKKPKVVKSSAPTTRAQTYIPGMDDVMGGGFRRNSVNLIAGGPGSGKTIFAMQFLLNGIENANEPGVYITFEQTDEELIQDIKEFGWDIEEKIKEKKLVVLSYTPEQVENVLHTGGGTVRDVVDSIKAKRVVIDSLTAFTLLHDNALTQRKACLDLFKAIKKWNCTALLLAEQEGNPELHSPTVEEFEVDGVLLLYNLRKGDVRERALEVFKMRGTKHSNKIFPMLIDEKGVTIYPEETLF